MSMLQLRLFYNSFFFIYFIVADFSEPWIPIENSRKTEITADLKGDVLAYATTLWEIFSRGRVPILKDVIFVIFPKFNQD